ncbi:hypothetical protein Droror1_Dr00025900 [Drosera rotundifolia]
MTSNYCSLLIIFFLLSILQLHAIEARNPFLTGSSLSVEDGSDFLTSPNNTFACGFYSVNGSNANYFAIWFTQSINRTVVWMANRDMPVNSHGSKVTLRDDGTLVLTDFDGSVTWQTNSTPTYAYKAALLESGNLVLINRSDTIIWQSFDFPTDTLLPNQALTYNNKLTSGFGDYMFASGYYSLLFGSNSVLSLVYNGPLMTSIYWPDPYLNVYQNKRTNYNGSRIAVFDDMGRFSSSDALQFHASDMGPSIQRRLKMDLDGNLRLYSLNVSSGLWSITWQAMSQLCDVHGICGINGICLYTTQGNKCACPPCYVQADLSDWTQGCKPMFVRSPNDSKFVELIHMDFYGFDLNYTDYNITLDECRDLCLGDYRCMAYNYRLDGQGKCWTKGALFNGYRDPGIASNIYLRLPGKVPPTITSSKLECNYTEQLPFRTVLLSKSYYTANQTIWGYLYIFAAVIGSLEILVLAIGFSIQLRNGMPVLLEDGYRVISTQFKRFSYDELKKATAKFNSVLGRGGSGEVYKGTLADGRVVAVKRLAEAMIQADDQFWAEVSMIEKIYHMNLVQMWGFCLEGKHRLLVYEYIHKGSLDKHLFSSNNLSWKNRFKVAVGTARGLAYLHHECLEWVIHCDIKPENILLDENFVPKIADFGLAKLSQRGKPGTEVTRIRGTKGYMAPEWAMNLPITAKVDVYSYGVVILELVRGIRLSSRVTGDDQEQEESELTSFLRTARGKVMDSVDDESWLEGVVDPRLDGNFSRKQAKVMVEVGVKCVSEERRKRPTMETVAQVLIECEEDSAMPIQATL